MENKRYHIVIGSIIFAVVLWLSVNMRDEYTIVRRIPVVLENMKDGKALKYPVPKFINVKFRGTGWLLAGLSISPDVKYFIDMSSIGAQDFSLTSRDLLEHIKLPFALQPLDVKPDSLILAVVDYTEKRVPVVSRVMPEYQDGYGQVGPLRLTPDSITLGGAEPALRTITEWQTTYRKYDGLHSPLDVTIPLEDPGDYGIELSEHSARVELNVQPFAEKTFAGIPVVATDVQPNREVIFIPPKMDIIVRGGIDQLAKLSPTDFQLTINYIDLPQDSMQSVTPTLTVPEDVKVVSKNPSRFQYIIRKRL